MRRSLLLLFVTASIITVIVLQPSPTTTAQPTTPSELAGQLHVVDAGQYPDLHAALAAVPETGGLLQVPPGTFEIDRPLEFHGENLLITGAGPATRIINTNEEGQPTIRIVPSGAFDRKATGNQRRFRWRIQITNLHLTGNPECGHGIDAVWVNEIQLENLSITAHGGDGIFLDHCYEDPRIHDCLLTYNRKCGLRLLGCHDIIVSANQFEENHDALQCLDSFNLCMTGNNLDDHLGHGVIIENTYGSVVSGNMIEECQGTAIILDRDCYGDTISSNVIAHNGSGIDLIDAHGCSISANTLTIMKTTALHIGPGSGRITVTGNNFSNSYLGGGKVRRSENDRSAGGVWLEQTSDISITGNVFTGLSEPAIRQSDPPSRRITLVGNIFEDVTRGSRRFQDSIQEANIEPSQD